MYGANVVRAQRRDRTCYGWCVSQAHSRYAVAIVLLAIGVCSCGTDNGPELAVAPADDAGIDGASPDREDGVANDAIAPDAEQEAETPADGSTASVTVGVTPTPAGSSADGGSSPTEGEALLLAVSSGARAIVVERSWSALADEDGNPNDAAWQALDQLCSFLRTQRRRILLGVKSVDVELDARPSSLRAEPWSAAATTSAMHGVVDRIYATCGEQIAYLSLGLDVDRYVAANPAEIPSFTQFALDATDYARSHPARPPAAGVGWTWSADSWLAEGELDESNVIVTASDVVILSYIPLDSKRHAKPPSNVSSDIAAMAARITSHPIVIQRATYPTSELIGGSEAGQAQFVEAMFASISSRRDRFPFVGAGLLHDPSPEDCLAYAEAQGVPGSPELFAVWCSVGLRSRDGAAKPAFASFVEAAAGLLDP